jgi:chromosome segregation ATPase
VELHRLLKPQGLLLVTFMGKGMSQIIADQEWNEDLFGMNVIRYGQSWKLGGPMVLHSPWWIEEHWGRAFEILSLEPDGFATKPWLDHGAVLMRKRETKIEARELDAIAPGDDREARALAHNIEQLLDECRELRSSLRQLEARAAELEQVRDELQGELDRAHDHAARAQGEVIALSRKATMALHEAAASRQQSLNSAQRLLKVEELVAGSKARVFALEEAVDEVTGRLERGERVLAGMKSSVSWRITAPLRALKRLR